jgi:hypothetical protein
LAGARPVLWQAWEAIVRAMAAAPGKSVGEIVADAGLGDAPTGWRDGIPAILAAASDKAFTREPERILRLAAGKAMAGLRGKVPARAVIAELEAGVGGWS